MSDYVFTFLNDSRCIDDVTKKFNDTLFTYSLTVHCNQTLYALYCNYIYPAALLTVLMSPLVCAKRIVSSISVRIAWLTLKIQATSLVGCFNATTHYSFS